VHPNLARRVAVGFTSLGGLDFRSRFDHLAVASSGRLKRLGLATVLSIVEELLLPLSLPSQANHPAPRADPFVVDSRDSFVLGFAAIAFLALGFRHGVPMSNGT